MLCSDEVKEGLRLTKRWPQNRIGNCIKEYQGSRKTLKPVVDGNEEGKTVIDVSNEFL